MHLRLSNLRWPLTAATALIGAVGVASLWASARWMSLGFGALVQHGEVTVMYAPRLFLHVQKDKGVHWRGGSPQAPTLWPQWKTLKAVPPRAGSSAAAAPSWVTIPLWMPLVVTGVFTARSWRSHRARTTAADRARTGVCPRCGYAREGLAHAAPCPECAFVPPPPP